MPALRDECAVRTVHKHLVRLATDRDGAYRHVLLAFYLNRRGGLRTVAATAFTCRSAAMASAFSCRRAW